MCESVRDCISIQVCLSKRGRDGEREGDINTRRERISIVAYLREPDIVLAFAVAEPVVGTRLTALDG